MPSILPAAIIGSAGAGLVGSSMQANAIGSAAQQQAAASQTASQQQMAMFNQVQGNLSPFMQGGQQALTQLQGLTGTGVGGNPLTAPLTSQFQPTMAQLEQTPGYQFSLDQGLKATQNSYAAQGLGALKGAANYAQGLASTTYQQQFQNNLSQNAQIANILQNQVNTGANSAAGLSNAGIQSTALSNQAAMSGAAASAAGTVGQANAYASGLSGLGGAATSYALINSMQNGGIFSPSTAYSGMNQTGLPGNAILGD